MVRNDWDSRREIILRMKSAESTEILDVEKMTVARCVVMVL